MEKNNREKPLVYTDFYALFERYCLMTEQKDCNEEKVLQFLKERTTEELFNMLMLIIGDKDEKKMS